MIKRVHPDLRDLLDAFPPLNLDYLDAVREGMANSPTAPIEEDIHVEDKFINGPDGNSLRVRIYQLKGRTETVPALLWIHGGGYVIGVPEGDDGLCQRFVKEAGCTVVSVDYRLAPEHPYPAPLEDCYSALKWIADNSQALNIDANRIGIAGASAGGGLTAALALLAKDRKGPNLIFQMPLYPMINDLNDNFSNKEITGNFIWNYSLNEAGWSMYLGDLKGSENIPYHAAPARATVEDLKGLPYTYTCVGQLDPFRDETLQYVTKLAQAGVDVDFHLYAGGYHAFETLNPHADIANNAVQEYINAVKFGLNRTIEVEVK
ncbi:alpha/beta hydrolase [Ureibacillus endophyticus]|uniref:Alpha/beta hydrolase n=1 Tax=Ureibacillus endophyticus TaxID=1978490 RepID=A0A494YY49_9BACL|nr:alpha/beta hydrolase [Lysinibacillus endophyticus]RKQ15146.1 alpha/beta hydrolase [Lysinibacillus endophyticus]